MLSLVFHAVKELEKGCNMIEKQENQVQPKKKWGNGKWVGIVSFIAIFCIIMFMAKILGHQAGKQRAIQTVQRESIAQNAPTGFMGAEWLMPISQVKSLFPDAVDFASGKLMLDTNAFERPAFVGFDFTDNKLLMVIVTFKGEKTESTYRQTHILLEKEYGTFSEPSSTNKHILASKKKIGRIAIEHHLYQSLGLPIEQVTIYRTKENTAY